MITGIQSVLSEKQIEMINDSAIQILQSIGMKVESETILDAMKREGAIVDYATCRVKITLDMFRRLLPEKHTEIADWQLEPPKENELAIWGMYPFILPWSESQPRKATAHDLQEALKAAHSLPEIAQISPPVTMADFPSMTEPLEAIAMTMFTTDKKLGIIDLIEPEQIKYAVELGEIHTGRPGETLFLTSCEYFTSPLIFSERSARCVLELAKFGKGAFFGTMPMTGLNAPGTIAGAVVLGLAEILGGRIIGKCLNPNLEWGGIACSGAIDMRSMGALISTPESTLQDVALYQICRRLYGFKIIIAEHFIDADEPGIQAAFEKTYRFFACASFSAQICLNNGLLGSGKVFSPIQFVLDIETNQALLRLFRGFDVNLETLAKEVISEECIKKAPDFLSHEHTLAHFKTNFWFPKLFTPHGESQGGGDRMLLERAYDRWRNAVDTYKPINISEQKRAAVQAVLSRARTDLLR